jgi:ketosteroid isomerase-like protein
MGSLSRRRKLMSHPNEDLLRKGYAAFVEGDLDTVMGLFTDDIKWHVPGSNPLAGDYTGKEEIGAFFGKFMELTNGTFRSRCTMFWRTSTV